MAGRPAHALLQVSEQDHRFRAPVATNRWSPGPLGVGSWAPQTAGTAIWGSPTLSTPQRNGIGHGTQNCVEVASVILQPLEYLSVFGPAHLVQLIIGASQRVKRLLARRRLLLQEDLATQCSKDL